MKTAVGTWAVVFVLLQAAYAQVDTSFIYRTNAPYGTLDLRVAKSATRYYYLQENKTFSFRETSPGVKTDTYRDLTSWDSSPYTQGNLREKNGTADYFIMNYRLLLPANYDNSYDPGYPLIIMMHGAGERGNCWDNGCYWADRTWRPLTNSPAAPTTSTHSLLNNDHNLLHGGQLHMNARNLAGTRLPNDPSMPSRAFPGFVLFPQNLNGWDATSVQDAIKLLRLVAKKYNVDENRIYIHGLSNGGYAVYESVKRAPWLFSAMLMMSATSDAGVTANATLMGDIGNIPMWAFQGSLDTNPTPAKTKGIVKKLRDAGLIVRYTEYSNLGHGTWNTAYNEPDFFTWILGKNKSNIHVYADIAAICRTTNQGVKMELAKGFRAYQWEKNGVIINGATTANYVATEPGIYRARFSRVQNPTEGQWNFWSDPVTVTESNPQQATFTQTGTVHLKDLNSYNNAHLNAVGEFAHYYWNKDGIRVDLPGNVDDTIKHPIFKQGVCTDLPQCTGNGVYTLITAGFDNCPSPPSQGIQIYFNNQSPINVVAPTAFSGSSSTPSSANLQWVDASSNELGFEIWRRKRLTSTTFSKWEMTPFLPPNVISYSDTGLDPATTYQYKIRAVNNGGKSNYTPSVSNQYLTIVTQPDVINPSVPQNLSAIATGIREITLSWEPSTDDTGIKLYEINANGSIINTTGPVTSYKLQGLELNTDYTFSIKAVDKGNNKSDASNEASADTYLSGLYYEHSTGGWTDLDLINWSVAEFRGQVPNITLAPRTQEDYFNFEFDGYLYITLGGTYQFRVTSDDGSRLTLNDVVIVENDGTHGNLTITSADRTLSAGAQLTNVKYFDYNGGHYLTMQYRGPDTGNTWILVPDNAWKSGTPAVITSSGRIATAGESTTILSVYPNPSNEHENINLIVSSPNSENRVHVSLVSMVGETFYQKSFDAKEIAAGTAILPERSMMKGVYVLIVRNGAETIKERIIIK
jgi:hypothetical protein